MATKSQARVRTPRRSADEPAAQPVATAPAPGKAVTASGGDGRASPAATPRAGSKVEALLALLSRAEGATLGEMADATGWQAHSVRASLTGLRKKGHAIRRSRRGDDSCYHVDGGA